MIIAYWSPVHGQAGTSSNILATALITGMVHKKKSILTQTHFNFNNLEAPLIGSNSKNSICSEYFRDVGLDTLIRSFKSSKLTRETLDNCCISLKNTNISLLPGTSKMNKDSFDYEMDTVFLNLLRTMEEIAGIIFVDINSGNHPLSLKIMENSSLTVVNLSQNIGIVDTFISNYSDKIRSKVFYLFGNYDSNSKYNLNNIQRRYWKWITPLNSGVIPYNTDFLDAQCDGRVIEFMRNNIEAIKSDKNGFFIHKAQKAAEKILRLSGVAAGNKERI